MRSAISADRIAFLVFVALAAIAAATFRDYGLGWDDFTHSQYGDLLLKLYGSGFSDTRALSFVNLYKYGGAFDMAAALAAKLLPFGLFETRRLIGAAIGLVGLFATFRLARRLGGPSAGLIALLLLATCPLYYGHMFINAKDAPFAAAMAVMLLGFVRALDTYPHPDARAVALAGIGIGLAFGSRILAVVAAPYVALALLLIVIAERRAVGWRGAAAHFGEFVLTMLPALALGYLMMGLLWPWSIVSPLNPVYATEYFDTFFEKPWKELYEGALISVPDMPATYLPHLFALKIPEIMLVLGSVGTIGSFVAAARPDIAANRRAGFLAVALAALMPVVIAMIARPALYNGLRHFVFVVPPFAALAGVAGAWLFDTARRYGKAAPAALAAVFLAGIAMPASDMVRLHPYEYTAFNWSSGGVRAVRDRYMLDYWGLAFKQAADDLRAKLAARRESPPAGRRWVVAICGPQSAAEVELGPQFETTWDEKKADFAMELGTFYCRPLQAPLLVNVEREGVSYARAYDLRGRPTPNLLTVPPPQ
ncbi:MAG TPA: glycosyltransferase family 39 protein [Pseudolabrys sp.]|nr:glycosyltransferase family 39 protein [Pseudolabrys sp.]